jgi:hypothetical protein
MIESTGARTKLSELAIGNDQGSKSAQSLEGLVAMLLRGLLVHWGIRCADSLRIELRGLPDEVLEQVALVLGQQQLLGLCDNFAEVFYESLALGGELVRGLRESLRCQEAVQGDINLGILA